MSPKLTAQKLWRKYRTSCPFKIARLLRITILYLALPENVKGYCDQVLRRKFIVLNQNLSEEEHKFVCAHELGHILLHKKVNHYFIKQHTLIPIGRYEREAHTFAVHLLTAGDSIEDGESVEYFLARNDVPSEMALFL
ncbi:ImmA/IrrE family metallo-endopeptidase [Paenibacillus ehimensis]|uniref:ImmA/IrrE family metallo-endopeptidase n=1 Tax=Paenibacillus ehimensis TaxID=79264 RepID=UPI000A05BA57|nr:ImmA/IrrE family metallo-endopeptidase [Paenibacillus ehimensis]